MFGSIPPNRSVHSLGAVVSKEAIDLCAPKARSNGSRLRGDLGANVGPFQTVLPPHCDSW